MTGGRPFVSTSDATAYGRPSSAVVAISPTAEAPYSMDPKLRASLDEARRRAGLARTSGYEARERATRLRGDARRAEEKRQAMRRPAQRVCGWCRVLILASQETMVIQGVPYHAGCGKTLLRKRAKARG
jgi:hypothetical protein